MSAARIAAKVSSTSFVNEVAAGDLTGDAPAVPAAGFTHALHIAQADVR